MLRGLRGILAWKEYLLTQFQPSWVELNYNLSENFRFNPLVCLHTNFDGIQSMKFEVIRWGISRKIEQLAVSSC